MSAGSVVASPRAVRCFTLCILLGLAAAVVFHSIMRWAGSDWPWTSFLYSPQYRFSDWEDSVAQAASGHPYFHYRTPALAAYFPGAYLILGWAARFSDAGNTLIYLGVGAALLGLGIFQMHSRVIGASAEGRRSLETPLLLFLACAGSYPVLFALDRGNLDLWIAGLCTLYVATQGTRCWAVGVMALAVAISAKGYPAAFLALSLARREYREALLCMAAALVISVVGLLCMRGGVLHSLEGLQRNLHLFRERYVLGPESLFASSDPYNAMRLLLSGLTSTASTTPSGAASGAFAALSSTVLRVYHPLCLLLAAIALYFVLAVRVPAWRRVTAICLIAILFPDVASDYKLCCLIPGLLLLLMTPRFSWRETAGFWLFCLLMIPKSYYYLNGRSISMLINPLLLLSLAWVVLADRSVWRRAWRRAQLTV